MSKKRESKVKLPHDRTGKPIRIGDVLEWEDGQRMKVAVMIYYGKEKKGRACWTAEDEDGGFSDNLENATIVWRSHD